MLVRAMFHVLSSFALLGSTRKHCRLHVQSKTVVLSFWTVSTEGRDDPRVEHGNVRFANPCAYGHDSISHELKLPCVGDTVNPR